MAEFPKQLILIGAGNTHLEFLKRWAVHPLNGLTVIMAAGATTRLYQGLAYGYSEGIYNEEELRIDLAGLCRKAGIALRTEPVAGLDLPSRTIRLGDGCALPFDLASLDLDPKPAGMELEGVDRFATPVRPVERLIGLKPRLAGRNLRLNIMIYGAGALGIETALALHHYLIRLQLRGEHQLTLFDPGQTILQGWALRTKELTYQILRESRIELLLGHKITKIVSDLLNFEDRTVLPYDELLWAREPVGDPMLAAAGLAVTSDGFLEVTSTLQSVTAPFIFGSGLGVTAGAGRGAGIAAVVSRERARLLYENMERWLNEAPLKTVKSSGQAASEIIPLGGGEGILQTPEFVTRGSIPWKWKQRMEQKNLKRLRP